MFRSHPSSAKSLSVVVSMFRSPPSSGKNLSVVVSMFRSPPSSGKSLRVVVSMFRSPPSSGKSLRVVVSMFRSHPSSGKSLSVVVSMFRSPPSSGKSLSVVITPVEWQGENRCWPKSKCRDREREEEYADYEAINIDIAAGASSSVLGFARASEAGHMQEVVGQGSNERSLTEVDTSSAAQSDDKNTEPGDEFSDDGAINIDVAVTDSDSVLGFAALQTDDSEIVTEQRSDEINAVEGLSQVRRQCPSN
ncbi:hypothetical protein LSAT2_033073 [Lamellibrachia satsuma]|nr:hypothetical protein LSAT2_033073 [Lamellibrachia satsuma]